MEIIKDLPEVFEEFAEQRQKSFLAVKQLKDKGIPVIGILLYLFSKGDCHGNGRSNSQPLLYI